MSDTSDEPRAFCQDCQRQYGDEHGFPDLIIPFWAWKRITPTEDDGGLLCPSCICKRLHHAGIKCEAAFMSGPVSISSIDMNLLRRIENIELAIEGRDNRWSGIRTLVNEGSESRGLNRGTEPVAHGNQDLQAPADEATQTRR